MEPKYFDWDIVYVQKTDHIETGEIGIFQKGNSIYIKKAGENGLISLNPNYPPLAADENSTRITHIVVMHALSTILSTFFKK